MDYPLASAHPGDPTVLLTACVLVFFTRVSPKVEEEMATFFSGTIVASTSLSVVLPGMVKKRMK